MAETNVVAIKFPTFWAQQPEVWFLPAETQFHIRKIVSGSPMKCITTSPHKNCVTTDFIQPIGIVYSVQQHSKQNIIV